MTVSTRGKNTFTSAGTTSLSLNKPTGTIDGDTMFTFFGTNGSWSAPNIPSGWTQVFLDAANGMTIGLWRKVASSEGASYSWSWTNNINGGFGIVSLIGVDTATPVLGFASTLASGASPVVWPSPSWAGAADAVSLLLWSGQAANPTTPPLPSGWNDSADGFNVTDGFQPAQFASNLTTQSSVTSLPTQSGAMTSGGFYDIFQVAVKVAAAAPPPPPSFDLAFRRWPQPAPEY